MALTWKNWLIVLLGAAIVGAVVGFVVYYFLNRGTETDSISKPVWGYKCEKHICKRVENLPSNINETTSFNVCRLTCGEDIGTLWPVPSGKVEFTRQVTAIDLSKIHTEVNDALKINEFWPMALDRFLEMQTKKTLGIDSLKSGASVLITANADSSDMTFDYDTFEGYSFSIYQNKQEIHIKISAKNFYGIRHALETVSQLIVYDEFENSAVILSQVYIEDEPKYAHRGLSLDTSRYFYSVASIKRTINALAMVKLNIFHWHITDSQSLPLEIKSRPELTRLGAYSPEKVYTSKDIAEIIKFAKSRGIRVIPEFDSPAHVGEGWQNTGLVLCYKDPSMVGPWRGQFDPTKDEVYDFMDDIYKELVESFNPNLFHIGADEVNIECWNTSTSIKEWMAENDLELTQEGFMEIWGRYLKKSVERLDNHYNSTLPVIIWRSSLTQDPYLTKYIDKERFIIQLWLDSQINKNEMKAVFEKGYKVIISNCDALYLDCGVGGWVDDKLNWCAPYKTWQKIYQNDPKDIAGEYIEQVYGAEVAVWSESTDEKIIDYRIWPRTSAFAERVWSDPKSHWRKAEPRLLINREYMVNIGSIAAEMLQPEWCLLIEGECPS